MIMPSNINKYLFYVSLPFPIFGCLTAIGLPFVFRVDEQGNVDNVLVQAWLVLVLFSFFVLWFRMATEAYKYKGSKLQFYLLFFFPLYVWIYYLFFKESSKSKSMGSG